MSPARRGPPGALGVAAERPAHSAIYMMVFHTTVEAALSLEALV